MSNLSHGPFAKHEYMDPQCKIALITGGATGIGFATAHELLCNNVYKVVITDIDTCAGNEAVQQLNDTYGSNKACFKHLNVNSSKQFEEVFKEITTAFGGVDILFNNAGIFKDNQWEFEIDNNLKSVVRGTLLAFRYMNVDKSKGGVVINSADLLGLEAFPHAPIYASTKSAVMSLSRSFGEPFHFKTTGIRVVGLCPGVTDTKMLRSINDSQLTKMWGEAAAASLLNKPIQKGQSVGRSVVYAIRYAPSGSIWIVQNGQLFKANLPDVSSYIEKVTQV